MYALCGIIVLTIGRNNSFLKSQRKLKKKTTTVCTAVKCLDTSENASVDIPPGGDPFWHDPGRNKRVIVSTREEVLSSDLIISYREMESMSCRAEMCIWSYWCCKIWDLQAESHKCLKTMHFHISTTTSIKPDLCKNPAQTSGRFYHRYKFYEELCGVYKYHPWDFTEQHVWVSVNY